MAFTFLNDVSVAYGGLDLTTQSNKVSIAVSFNQLENTTYRNGGFRGYQAGLADTDISVDGYWQAGTDSATPAFYYPDQGLFTELTSTASGTPISVATGQAIGSVAYLTRAKEFSYQLLGSVGELAPFTASAKGNQPVVRGITLSDPDTQLTATAYADAGTPGRLLGATSSTQTLYAALHVFTASGTTPSLTARIDSDSTAAMSDPTTVGTFSAATGPSSQFLSVAGVNADTYYAVHFTISGTLPKFKALVTVGIR